MKQHIKSSIFECILCALCAAGLSANFYNGFEMNDVLSFSFPAIFGITFVIMAVIYLFCYNRLTKILGGAIGVLVLAVLLVYLAVSHPFAAEETQSSGIFWTVIFVMTVITFFITRIKIGCFILMGLGNIMIAGEAFLQFGISVVGYICFLFAAGGMIFSYVFKKNLIHKKQDGSIFARFALQMLVIGGAAAAAAALIVALVIVPMHLPTSDLKLIEELRSMELIQKIGTTMQISELNDTISNNTPTDKKTSDSDENSANPETGENGESQGNEGGDTQSDNEKDETQDDDSGGVTESIETPAHAVNYNHDSWLWLYILIAVVVLIVLSVVIRKVSRKKWFEKVSALPRREGVIEVYRFIFRCLKLVKVRRKKSLSLEEFAFASRKFTEPFVYGDTDFRQLTEIYERAYYGNAEITEEEWKLFAGAYEDIYDNIYDEIGKWHYLLLFYRI